MRILQGHSISGLSDKGCDSCREPWFLSIFGVFGPRQWGESAIKIEFLAIVHGAAVVDFCSVVVIGIRAPEEDVDMGTEVDMGVGVDVGLGVGAGRGEIHDQQEGQE